MMGEDAFQVSGCALQLRKGSLLEQTDLEALVIPANKQLTLGWGSHLAEAVLAQAGTTVEQLALQAGRERYPDGCPLGGAVITPAGRLPVTWLIHAAVLDKYDMNPLFLLRLRQRTSDDTLRLAVRNSCSMASEKEVKSIGLSLMGAGIGGMKTDKCCRLILEGCIDYLTTNPGFATMRLCVLKEKDYRICNQVFAQFG